MSMRDPFLIEEAYLSCTRHLFLVNFILLRKGEKKGMMGREREREEGGEIKRKRGREKEKKKREEKKKEKRETGEGARETAKGISICTFGHLRDLNSTASTSGRRIHWEIEIDSSEK